MLRNSNQADAWYDHTKPWQVYADTQNARMDPANGPFPSNPERITSERMMQQLLASPPPVTRELFPDRYGFVRTALGIADIINVDDVYKPPVRDTWSTGSQGSYSGTSTPSYVNTLGNA